MSAADRTQGRGSPQEMKTENLLWLLLWAVMLTAIILEQVNLAQARRYEALHARVLASELWHEPVTIR